MLEAGMKSKEPRIENQEAGLETWRCETGDFNKEANNQQSYYNRLVIFSQPFLMCQPRFKLGIKTNPFCSVEE